MTSTSVFLDAVSAKFNSERTNADVQFNIERERLSMAHQAIITNIETREERYLSLVGPLLGSLDKQLDGFSIEDIHAHDQSNIMIVLLQNPGASLTSLLLELPALTASYSKEGEDNEGVLDKADVPKYTGLLIEAKNPDTVYWKTELDGREVSIACKNENVHIEPWRNPMDTGAPVSTIRLGDLESSIPWVQVGLDSKDYWVQPANSLAREQINNAEVWLRESMLRKSLREDFNDSLTGYSSLGSARANMVLNALFSWATSEQPLPSKEDLLGWPAPKGNVIAMHTVNDWNNLVDATPANPQASYFAKEKINMLAARLPNIHLFADSNTLDAICQTMAKTQTLWQANQLKESPSLIA